MYRSIVLVHIACGIVALPTYWMAALARKGSPFHKAAGTAYLASMVGIVLSSIYLAASFFIDGKPVGEYPAVALEGVPVAGFFGRTWDTIQLWFK